MPSFVRWWRFVFGVALALLVLGFTRGASAYPGEHQVNATPVRTQTTYITTGAMFGFGCPVCHGDPTAVGSRPLTGNPGVNPSLTISGTGTSGSGTSFAVQPGRTATFTLNFTNNNNAGGFIVFHNAGDADSEGTLSNVNDGTATRTHSCPDGGATTNATTCGPIAPAGNTNHEIMHAVPAVGQFSTFKFDYTPPAVCSGGPYSFSLWVNSADGLGDCGPPDSPYLITFTISVASCDDGNPCNGTETCNGFFHSCFPGSAPATDDGNSCTSDGCNAGGVFHTPLTGPACPDGNLCNGNETCQSGVCTAGSPPTVNDGNSCTADSCSAGGGVVHTPLTGPACPDGDLCNGDETCQAGTCTAGSPPTVNDGNPCTADSCSAAGGVVHTPLTGTACPDGNLCNGDELCSAGVCQPGSGPTIDDGNPCTADSCSPGGGVLHTPLNGTACPDGNLCNGNETCVAGTCTAGSPPTVDDGNVCTVDTCTPAGGVTHTAAASNTVCHDGSRGPCDAVVTCGGATTCPALNVDHTNKQCSPPSCTAGTATPAEQCDGTSFNCPAATPVSCGGAICSGTSCAGGCAGDDANCTSGNFCLANVCTPKKAVGVACSANNYCANGQCVDGVCCNTTCGNSDPTDCQVCNLPASKGTCSVPVGTTCRASTGICDAAELCVSGNFACPTDAPAAANTVCRASTDGNVCDPAETCSGQFTCPPNTATRDGAACTNDGNACSLDLCESNVCTHDQAAGTSVVCRASAGVCDPAENCPATGTTCPGNTLFDNTHQCRAPAAGTNCDVPESCTGGVNCPTDAFAASTVSCRGASCANGVATLAANCPSTSASCPTIVTKDCSPYLCSGTACGTTCNVKTDCDAGFFCNAAKKCVAELPPGAVCSAGDSCGTGICVDGVCCNSQCTGQCQACDVPGKLGTCSPVPATDKVPHGSRTKCTGDGSVCQGVCDGVNTSSCALPGATTQCLAPTCTAGVATPVEFCHGTGTCPAPDPVTCAPGICQAATGPKAVCVGGGGIDCNGDVECAAGNYCHVGKCIPTQPNGAACTGADDECTNGHCVDSVCCNTSCDGQCEACNVGNAKGTCTAVRGEAPHRAACVSDPQFPACGGVCDGKNRLSCVFPGPGTTCREASCTKDVATLPASCTGTGTCSPSQEQPCQAPNGCNTAGTICDGGCVKDGDCSLGKYCAGGVCVTKLGPGEQCSTDSQCIGPCVDGVCCNNQCDHQCEACNVPGHEGDCQPVTGAPVNLRAPCASDGTPACTGSCNGVNRDACTYPGATKQCAAGSCTSGVATLTAFCDGAGACPDKQLQICAPSDCVGPKCGGDCAVSGTCTTGNYCSAGVCKPKLPTGSVCGAGTQCANGICTDGFCCNAACDGQCQACDVAGAEGTCTTLTGDLPHGGRAACRGFGACAAICDGTNPMACAYAGATTTCGKASCAVNGDQLAAPVCNSNGGCLPADELNCGAYTCDTSSGKCQTTCLLATDCAAGFDCVDSKCQMQNDAGVMDAGTDAAMPDGSLMTDAGDDGTAPDGSMDGAVVDSGNAGASDGGPVLVPPEHSTDKGSCGCSVPGSDSSPSNALLLATLALVGISSRRRRRAGNAPRSAQH